MLHKVLYIIKKRAYWYVNTFLCLVQFTWQASRFYYCPKEFPFLPENYISLPIITLQYLLWKYTSLLLWCWSWPRGLFWAMACEWIWPTLCLNRNVDYHCVFLPALFYENSMSLILKKTHVTGELRSTPGWWATWMRNNPLLF